MRHDQPSLYDLPRWPRFDGETYEPELDGPRLSRQLVAVATLMADGDWRTLREIGAALGEPEASCSARLRDLRKPKFGGHTVNRRRRGEGRHGIFEYQLVPRNPDQKPSLFQQPPQE